MKQKKLENFIGEVGATHAQIHKSAVGDPTPESLKDYLTKVVKGILDGDQPAVEGVEKSRIALSESNKLILPELISKAVTDSMAIFKAEAEGEDAADVAMAAMAKAKEESDAEILKNSTPAQRAPLRDAPINNATGGSGIVASSAG